MAKLNQEAVSARLKAYDSTGITNELYDMGKILVNEAMERFDCLDAKATRTAGYTGAIISLMVSTFPIWTSAVAKWAVLLIAVGSLVGLLGGSIALASTWPRRFPFPSDTDWLEEDGFGDPDRLKRYYILSMHQAIASHDEVNASKATKIKFAQMFMGVMILFLLVGLGNATYRSIRRSSQPFSDRGALVVSGQASLAFQHPH